MKKKNLIILLIIPFVIALIGIAAVNVTFNTFYSDISAIEWEYEEVEAFSKYKKHILNAKAVTSDNALIDDGNHLVWKIENKDGSILDPIAKIEINQGITYLVPITEGEVIITCSNFKGNVFKRMIAYIYGDGVITITPVLKSSQNNIDPNNYYGQYDLDGNNKVLTTIKLKYTCIPDDLYQSCVINTSSNISYKLNDRQIELAIDPMSDIIDSFVTITSKDITSTYYFKLVKNGVNVYSYSDLMYCTNKSEAGEIVVLRKSLESLENYTNSSDEAIALFGNYSNKKFDFKKDVYRFKTTFNNEFIKGWNEFVKGNSLYSPISDEVIAGIRVQKDFYGNGYTINLHNLAYPSLIKEVERDGNVYKIPTLDTTDLFRGPLPFYTLGNYHSMPLVTSYGQDNIGMYVDGNNIIINDLNLKNCDMPQSLSFLETVGTVMEINGDNNRVVNCRLSNGKNVLRSFSSNNLVIDNSYLSNSMNFLITTGSNEYKPIDDNKTIAYLDNDVMKNSTILEYLSPNGVGDTILNNYLKGSYNDIDKMRNQLLEVQNILNPDETLEYKGSMVINDTYFYKSGLASIALESLFNGPFLYTASPSFISSMFSQLEIESRPLVPYTATNISGLSYPVSVELKGNTRFYDYKRTDEIDLSGLIDENISKIAKEVLGEERDVDIDDIFPLIPLLTKEAVKPANNAITTSEGKSYMNVPIAYYGGALNKSMVITDNLEGNIRLKGIKVDFFNDYLNLTSNTTNYMAIIKDIMVKCVTVVTGFEPFEFVCCEANGYLFGETPNISDLIANAKGV